MKSPQRIKKVTKMRRIRKWKVRSLVTLCILTFIIVLLTTFIYTSLGIKVISSVIEKAVPQIQIKHAKGALNDLNIDGFTFKMDGVEVSVGEAKVSLSGLCLIKGKICVKSFQAKDIYVNIETDKIPKSESKTEQPQSLKRFVVKTPLPIELKSAQLEKVNVNVDNMHFELSSFQGQANWINQFIYVLPTTAMDVKAIFPDWKSNPSSSNLKPKKSPFAINETIETLFNQPLIQSLPNVNIPLDIFVNHLTGNGWVLHIGGNDYFFDDVVIEASTVNSLVDVRLVETNATSDYAKAHIQVKGQIKLRDEWPIKTDILAKTNNTTAKNSSEFNSHFEGQLLGELATQTHIKGLNQADIFAKINFFEKYMPLTLKMSGKHLQWPVINKADYQLNDFDIDLSGLANLYHFNVKGEVNSKDILPTHIEIQSNGTNEYIDINKTKISLPQGELALSGKISWLNKLHWDTKINFNQIDLSQWSLTYPIKMNGNLLTSGEYDERAWLINLNRVNLTGEINHAPLQISGDLGINSNQYLLANNFNLNWDSNRIELNGSTKQDDFIANVNFPNLKVINPKILGNIVGHVNIKGTLKQPIITSNLVINKLILQDIVLEQAVLNGEISYSNMINGDISLKLKKFNMPNMSVNNATVSLQGNEQKHQLTLNVNGKPLSSEILLNGSFNKNRSQWQGIMSQANAKVGKNNLWQINHPIVIDYDINRKLTKIFAHCWLNTQSSICLDNDIVLANKGMAEISLKNIDLDLIDPFINSQTNIAGYINGKANIKWDPNTKIPTITVNLSGNNVHVRQQISSQTLPIPFDLFNIDANLNDKQANLKWRFGFKNLGKFKGDIRIIEPLTTKRLDGQIDIDNLSLAMINPLLNDNEHANGFINSHLKFSGSLLDPYITGNFDLEHSEIKTNQLPVDVRSIMIDMDFNGKSSDLKGTMKTKAGVVNINGKANWKNIDNWDSTISVKGDALEVNIAPLLTMQIIPDIHITANQQQLDLTGQVTIPKANIQVESLPPSTVDVSSDEVMLDNHLQPVQAKNSTMAINSHVLVSLGDDVTIDAYGLAANLTGKLFVTQSIKGTTVNGQINIPKGRFHAYGQDLVVRKGEIIFAGLPEQPRINIEAIRNQESIDDNVTAGIRVTGLADEPKVEIFSDPAMSQQEALSYLLRGQGLSSDEQSDNDMFTALLIGLGTAQTGSLVGDIGNTFGIKNLSLDTQGVGNSQKVVVSGYLLPNLQLKYGVGIFDSLAVFTLRYRLLPRLYLDVASGLDQTVDLIYQFEF